MITDQELACRELEIAELFRALQTETRTPLPPPPGARESTPSGSVADNPSPSPSQRIERILRRLEEAVGEDDDEGDSGTAPLGGDRWDPTQQ